MLTVINVGGLVNPYELSVYPGSNLNQDLTGKTEVSSALAAERNRFPIIVGQSLGANTSNTQYTASNSKSQHFNLFNGKVYRCVDPLLTADTNTIVPADNGNLGGKLCDKLISDNFCDRVILTSMCVGGTLVSDWSVGVLVNHIQVCGLRMQQIGYTPTEIVWMQGQADVAAGTSATTYKNSLRQVVANFRTAGINAPFFVCLSADYPGANGAAVAAVRSGQTQALDGPLGIYAGPDLDTLVNMTNGYDGLHYNGTGTTNAANLIAGVIEAH